jgi:hypothetical protein
VPGLRGARFVSNACRIEPPRNPCLRRSSEPPSWGADAAPVFKAAYKELCTRIWIELELLAQAAGPVESGLTQHLIMSTVILRLELLVLVDCCRSPRWRRMLSAEQRDSLCSMLTDVLAALYVDLIAEAQDRVLDELLPESEAGPSLADPVSGRDLGRHSHPAIDELVSLIEAQAAARAAR